MISYLNMQNQHGNRC